MSLIYPVINIDRERCTTPFDCKRCLRICPSAVFNVGATHVVRGMETDKTQPGTYSLFVKYRDKCTGCNKCVEVCPVNALSLVIAEEVRA